MKLKRWLVIAIFSVTTVVHAETCSYHLKKRAGIHSGLSAASLVLAPLYGIGILFSVVMGSVAYDLFDKARILTSASIVKHPKGYDADVLKEANKILDHFYKDLEKKNKLLRIKPSVVMETLNQINLDGRKYPACNHLLSNAPLSSIFRDGGLGDYTEKRDKRLQEQKKVEEAKKQRQENYIPNVEGGSTLTDDAEDSGDESSSGDDHFVEYV